MPRKKSDFSPGEHPHSQGNLQPREPMYGEAKKRRQLLATDEGWEGFKALATSMGLSASELVERLGRGTIPLEAPQGDVLTVVKWGNVHCKAVDANGAEYACKRVSSPD
ncbi:hypothetical protein [Nodosilinea sp. FACHB-141]|uniref:hypothetical protein n=1 Tax=Nodosilinea sp. FACHB-141 TaxID=2692833 RepID=UPI001683AE49|nr:hypothetical protein [Nodosilinea sp. FACHB-141]